MTEVDYLIVGSGLTGSVIARQLVDAGCDVLVVDRRSHLGGNVHDQIHEESNIRFHTYGPHYFRTGSDKIWEYVNQFSSFYKYEAIIKSQIDSCEENWPISDEYIKRTIGENWKPAFKEPPRNFEEASLAMMPKQIYEKFVKSYTEKQWGVAAHTLDVGLAGRFDVRLDNDPRLKLSKYQGIPTIGYAGWMENLLHGITVIRNFDYLKNKDKIKVKKLLVFTGPIDEFYNFKLGALKYRGQKRESKYLPTSAADCEYLFSCGQINTPNSINPHIRILEWKHMLSEDEKKKSSGIVLTFETPFTPTDPNEYEYPFPDRFNSKLYKHYRLLAGREKNTLICGRLGEYKYYDMDQAIGRALVLAERIIKT